MNYREDERERECVSENEGNTERLTERDKEVKHLVLLCNYYLYI